MSAIPKRLLAVTLAFCVPALAIACSVPVFRYAIEHWRPDAYQLFVYHDQALNDADQSLLGWIEEQTKSGANVTVRTIDINDSLEPIDRARWDELADQSLPRLVVQLPRGIAGGEAPVSSSPWNENEVKRLLASPARTDLGERLVAGEVVWVFLDSGSDQDDSLFELLNQQLAIQQESLELPQIEEQDLGDLSADPESLEIRFSSLRVSRDDPAEKWFAEMLLSVEPDLRDEELVDQPMVFPVFGRGRALYALVGQGINADMIGQAATFLTGACQCTVKAENPGVDLLIPVRWDDLIEVSEPEEVSLPLVGLGGGLPLADDQPSPDARVAAVPATANEATSKDEPSEPVGDADDETPAQTAAVPAPPTAVAPSPVPSLDPAPTTTVGADGLLASSESGTPVIWLPIVVLLVIGTVVVLLGTSILRRQ